MDRVPNQGTEWAAVTYDVVCSCPICLRVDRDVGREFEKAREPVCVFVGEDGRTRPRDGLSLGWPKLAETSSVLANDHLNGSPQRLPVAVHDNEHRIGNAN